MTSTVALPPAGRAAPRPGRTTYGDSVRTEWTKFWTVTSTYWTLLVAAVLSIGLGALFSGLAAHRYHTDISVRIGWNPTDHSLRSLLLGQLAFAVLGVMIVTSEYSNGLIRTSLTAVPKRFRMMSSKLLVLFGVLLVAGQVIAFRDVRSRPGADPR